VIYPKTGSTDFEIVDLINFKEKYDLEVDQFVEFKSLMGDDSDNIAGVKNCGFKNAQKILKTYGSLSNAVLKKDEISGKIGENFRDWIPSMEKTLKLVNIKKDLVLPYNFEDCKIDLKWENSENFLNKLECFSLVKRIKGGKMYNVN
jgi:DNA polymerase-1